jgi:hypothetical protein
MLDEVSNYLSEFGGSKSVVVGSLLINEVNLRDISSFDAAD